MKRCYEKLKIQTTDWEDIYLQCIYSIKMTKDRYPEHVESYYSSITNTQIIQFSHVQKFEQIVLKGRYMNGKKKI